MASCSVHLVAASKGAVRLRFVEPGKAIQEAVIESFNGRRDECLNERWFLGLADVRRIVEAWREDYNRARPHCALGYRTPAELRADLDFDGVEGALVRGQVKVDRALITLGPHNGDRSRSPAVFAQHLSGRMSARRAPAARLSRII